ncbi:organic solute transporter subunit alpha [Bombina bombina]|uniref:organic solute transporter subunit alpha n=1 Tax=Bombina bombina TaxID=8345 RepID=UPI00235B2412|nr:organic solute transporter subunit alpha [Bombina bombina]
MYRESQDAWYTCILRYREQVIKKDLWIFMIPVLAGVVQLALFLEEMGFFLRNIQSLRRTCLYLWILGVYPVFCISCIIGLYIPRSSSICNFVASIYHSITLWKFMDLITDFFGGKAQMLEELEGQTVSPNPVPCCCCCCFPNIVVNRSSLRWMNIAVYQISAVRTLLFFLGLILWTDEKYDYGDVGYTNPNSYINIIIGLSTFLSFYGYLLFYKTTKKALAGYAPRSKFICITLVLVLCGLQNGILETMAALGVIPCMPPFGVDTRSQTIYNYSLTLEMFFISLFARYCFRRVEPCLEQETSGQEATQNKSSQTTLVDMYSLSDDGYANTGYISDADETLCRIEHAPLDKYDFMQQEVDMAASAEHNNFSPWSQWQTKRERRNQPLELGNLNTPQELGMRDTGESAAPGKGGMQVKAQINYIATNEATVV